MASFFLSTKALKTVNYLHQIADTKSNYLVNIMEHLASEETCIPSAIVGKRESSYKSEIGFTLTRRTEKRFKLKDNIVESWLNE